MTNADLDTILSLLAALKVEVYALERDERRDNVLYAHIAPLERDPLYVVGKLYAYMFEKQTPLFQVNYSVTPFPTRREELVFTKYAAKHSLEERSGK